MFLGHDIPHAVHSKVWALLLRLDIPDAVQSGVGVLFLRLDIPKALQSGVGLLFLGHDIPNPDRVEAHVREVGGFGLRGSGLRVWDVGCRL